MEQIKKTVEELFRFDRHLLGSGYDNALEYLNTLLGLKITEVPSGTEFSTWTVPDEWVLKEGWVKFNGEKILDISEHPMTVIDYSLPFSGKISKEDLQKHLYVHGDDRTAIPYVFRFYDRDWGFAVPKSFIKNEDDTNALPDGEYEVFIDSEFRPGKLKYGVHTIPGKSDREILLFAHLDHPSQANDNLSGIACLLDIASRLKAEHTIKLIFCPETIGSIAYAHTEDLSKVDFVIAVDICGNANPNGVLFQKSWNAEDRINRVVHCALNAAGKVYRKGKFRTSIGSDETIFNDPSIGIPGVMFTTWPYDEYHTHYDTPDRLNYDQIKEVADLIINSIFIYENDYIPERNFKGPLMRSRYDIPSIDKITNLNWDYLIYSIDGKKTLAELAADFEWRFEWLHEILEKIIKDGKITKKEIGGSNPGKGRKPKAAKKK